MHSGFLNKLEKILLGQNNKIEHLSVICTFVKASIMSKLESVWFRNYN